MKTRSKTNGRSAATTEPKFEMIFELENGPALGFRGDQLVAVNRDGKRELTLAESVRFLRDMSVTAEMMRIGIQWGGDEGVRKWLTMIEDVVPE